MSLQTLKLLTAGILLATSLSAAEPPARPQVSLDGAWEFRMDPKGEGEAGKWFDAGVAYPDKIQVPGNWQAQGFGEPSGIAKHNYQGKAWYRREIPVPADWQGRRVWLRFEGVCNWGDVYVDGMKVGRVDSFVAPYEFDVTERVTPGRSHRLDVMVDSNPQPGAGYSGMMQILIPAGGITSHVRLEARPPLRLDRVSLGTEAGLQGVFATVRAVREDPTAAWSGRGRLRVLNPDGSTAAEGEAALTFAAGARESAAVDVRAAFPSLRPWSPDDPHLYQVAVELLDQETVIDGVNFRTGFRTLVTDTNAGNFLLNGKVIFLSGIGYDSLEPIHGTPPPDKATYVERLRHLKNYGFNYVRFLAHTPLREFFEAADEVGILVESEGEYYAGQQPMVPGAAPLLAAQVPRLIRAFENHPSWFAFSCFNEAWDAHIDPPKRAYVQAAYKAFRELKPDHYFLASDGGHDQWPTDIITDISVMGRADEQDVATGGPPQQVFRGAVANLATFSRALEDAEIQDLAAGPPETEAQQKALAKLKPAWQASGTVQAPGTALTAEAASALPARGGAMSVSLWVKPEAFAKGDWGTMFSCGDATPGKSLILSLNGEAGDGRMMIGRYQDNILASKNALVAGQWNHLALTADGKTIRLWVNGKPDGEIPAALDLPQTELTIGRLLESTARKPSDYRSRPHLFHEMDHTYLAALPDLDIESRLTGAVTQGWVLEPHRKRLESYGLLPRYKEIRSRSFAHYRDYVKQSFENTRRLRPLLDGYAWWLASDVSGGAEGDVSSLGVLDMLYQPEKFPDATWFRQFNRESVLLASTDIEQRVLATGETKPVDISLSHYGGTPVENGELTWKVTDGGKILDEGRVSGIQSAPATITKLASLKLGPFDFASPKKITLAVELNSTACRQSNQWEFWVFPARKQGLSPAGVVNLTGEPQLDARYQTGDKRALPEAKVVLAKTLTPELLAWVQAGGSAILLEQNTEVSAVMRPSVPGSPAIPPSSMLAQSGGQSYWPLWIRCNAQWVEPHPALGDFPNDGHCGFQWMRLFGGSVPTVDFTPNDSPARKYVRPIVAGLSLIPWKEDATRYGVAMAYGAMLSECRIGSGRVITCNLWALDGVKRGLPEAGYLLDCLVDYALSDKPAPGDLPALTDEEARKLFRIENQTMFYKARTIPNQWDPWMIYHNGTHYLYSLVWSGGTYIGVDLATSTDGVHWTEVGPVIRKRDDATWLGSGEVWRSPDFEKDGKFIMNFSQHINGEPSQSIWFAESKDLVHWTPLCPEQRFQCDPQWYRPDRWDMINAVPRSGGGYYGYWTAAPKGFDGFGFGESLDGLTWRALEAPKIDWGDRPKPFAAITEALGAGHIGDKWYVLLATVGPPADGQPWYASKDIGVRCLVADRPDGPFRPQARNYNFSVPNTDAYTHRFYRTGRAEDGVLIYHMSLAGVPPGEMVHGGSATVYFPPLKQALVDADGNLRMGWWKGNDKLKQQEIALQAAVPGTSPVAMLGNRFELADGLVLEGDLEVPAAADANGPGLFIEQDGGAGTALVIRPGGALEWGHMAADGAGFAPERRTDRELALTGKQHFRVLLKHKLVEFYLNDVFIHGLAVPGKPTGRIGVIKGVGNGGPTSLRAWKP